MNGRPLSRKAAATMRPTRTRIFPFFLSALFLSPFLSLLPGCGGRGGNQVVRVYCAQDQQYATLILQRFEKETGITVKPLFDTELTKTVGLVHQIVEEASRPRCDVFWNNEVVNTIKLKDKGVLVPFHSAQSAGIPAPWKDPEGYWVGFAARARVIIVNTRLLPDPSTWPRSIFDLADPKWKGKCCLARPRTGTTLTHFAALYQVLGKEKAEAFFRKILANQAGLTQGNAHVRRQVSEGKYAWGLTDTDDFNVARQSGAPVARVFPDQEGIGTMVIPNTVCKIKGCPHPEAADKLIDFLLSPKVEALLAKGPSAQIPLRPGVPHPSYIKQPDPEGRPGTFKSMKWDPVKLGGELDKLAARLAEIFSE